MASTQGREVSTRLPLPPEITIEAAPDIDQQEVPNTSANVQSAGPNQRRQRTIARLGRREPPSKNKTWPSTEGKKPVKAVNPPSKSSKLIPTLRVLHQPETKSSCLVDIIVVYMFNGKQGDGKYLDLTLFEFEESIEQTGGQPPKRHGNSTLLSRPEDTQEQRNDDNPLTSKEGVLQVPGPKKASQNVKDGLKSTPTPTNSAAQSAAKSASKAKADSVPPKQEPSSMRKKVNWLKDSEMLPKAVPDARVLSVGLDIHDCTDVPLDLEAGAAILCNRLTAERADCSKRPILFVGHAYGGIIIEQALVSGARRDTPEVNSKLILESTAGLFLFSCPVIGSDKSLELLADLYGLKKSSKFFVDMGDKSDKLCALTREFNANVLQPERQPQSNSNQIIPRSRRQKRAKILKDLSRRTGFTVVQYIGTDEPLVPRKTHREDPESVLPRTKDFRNVMKFSSPEEKEFKCLSDMMVWAVQARKLFDAATGTQNDMESLLNNENIDVNLKDRWDRTALHIAVQRGNAPVARLLLGTTYNAKPSLKDDQLNTPLHYAVRRNDIHLVQALLEAEADVNAENRDSETPITLANRSSRRIVKLLRSQPLGLVEGLKFGLQPYTGERPIAKQTKEAQTACKSFMVTATEVFRKEDTDQYWRLTVSVQEIIYGLGSVENILSPLRPRNVRGTAPLCTWLHIHQNNMTWVEDLFARLGYCGSLWAGRGHTSEVPHSRTITSHVAVPPIYNEKNGLLAIFVPFLSYEVNEYQEKMDEFIRATHKEHLDDRVWKAWRQRTGVHPLLQSKGSQAYRGTESLFGFEERDEGGSEISNDKNADASVSGSPNELLQASEATPVESTSDADSDASDSDVDAAVPGPYDIDKEDKCHIKAYLNDPPSLHVRRTLDQYYYHMLSSTRQRDRDQVVTRWMNRRSWGWVKPHNILMVDQLWLWLFKGSDNREYIISSFPDRAGADSTYADNLRQLVMKPQDDRRPISNATDLVFRIFATCSNIFDRCQDVEMLQFLQIFESSIGKVSDRETLLFKTFRNRSRKLHRLSERFRGFEIKKNNLLNLLLDIRQETELLVEIKDILDEINIIMTVLRTQNSILLDAGSKNPVLVESAHFEDARRILETSTADFERMRVQAKAVKSSLDTLMDLKQKAANAWEAHSAREGAVATAKQGMTMIVFTGVTIIFLPLSFMTSFFALDISSFPQDPNTGQTNWPLGHVSAFIFGISAAVILPLLLIAINLQWIGSVWKTIRKEKTHTALLHALRIMYKMRIKKLNYRIEDWFEDLKHHRDRYTRRQYESDLPLFENKGSGRESDRDTEISSQGPDLSSSSDNGDDDDPPVLIEHKDDKARSGHFGHLFSRQYVKRAKPDDEYRVGG